MLIFLACIIKNHLPKTKSLRCRNAGNDPNRPIQSVIKGGRSVFRQRKTHPIARVVRYTRKRRISCAFAHLPPVVFLYCNKQPPRCQARLQDQAAGKGCGRSFLCRAGMICAFTNVKNLPGRIILPEGRHLFVYGKPLFVPCCLYPIPRSRQLNAAKAPNAKAITCVTIVATSTNGSTELRMGKLLAIA